MADKKGPKPVAERLEEAKRKQMYWTAQVKRLEAELAEAEAKRNAGWVARLAEVAGKEILTEDDIASMVAALAAAKGGPRGGAGAGGEQATPARADRTLGQASIEEYGVTYG